MVTLFHWLILPLFLVTHQSDEFKIDPSNTKIQFTAKHFGVINVKGHFSEFEGSLTLDGDIVRNAIIKINVNSIYTGNNGRDNSLKNDTFLDAEDHPYITFESNGRDSPSSIQGTLAIKGSTKVATIPYTLERKDGDTSLLKGEYLLKRTDYNLVFGSMNDLVSNEIKVFLELRLLRKKGP